MEILNMGGLWRIKPPLSYQGTNKSYVLKQSSYYCHDT
jgi:hypothetical protein